MSKTAEPTPDIAHYDDGGVRHRGFQLAGEVVKEIDFSKTSG